MADSASLKISEIFYSLQREGINTGKPVVFLRTSHCNLACSGAIQNTLGIGTIMTTPLRSKK